MICLVYFEIITPKIRIIKKKKKKKKKKQSMVQLLSRTCLVTVFSSSKACGNSLNMDDPDQCDKTSCERHNSYADCNIQVFVSGHRCFHTTLMIKMFTSRVILRQFVVENVSCSTYKFLFGTYAVYCSEMQDHRNGALICKLEQSNRNCIYRSCSKDADSWFKNGVLVVFL